MFKNMIKNKAKIFQSPDSQYFLRTAAKLTFVPALSLIMVSYSIWLFLDFYYAFFVANGYMGGDELKTAFFDHLFNNVNHYFLYAFFYLMGTFCTGLLLAQYITRPFRAIKSYVETNPKAPPVGFQVDSFNEKQLIYKSIFVLFNYLKFLKIDGQHNKNLKFSLPTWAKEIKSPKMDRVFYVQYLSIIIILGIISSFALYSFTALLHDEITNTATGLLKIDDTVAKFIHLQQNALFKIHLYTISIFLILYAMMARDVITQMDGVCYAFFRDIKDIVSGNHHKKIIPRFKDPGQEVARSINYFLEKYFMELNPSIKAQKIAEKEITKPSFDPDLIAELRKESQSSPDLQINKEIKIPSAIQKILASANSLEDENEQHLIDKEKVAEDTKEPSFSQIEEMKINRLEDKLFAQEIAEVENEVKEVKEAKEVKDQEELFEEIPPLPPLPSFTQDFPEKNINQMISEMKEKAESLQSEALEVSRAARDQNSLSEILHEKMQLAQMGSNKLKLNKEKKVIHIPESINDNEIKEPKKENYEIADSTIPTEKKSQQNKSLENFNINFSEPDEIKFQSNLAFDQGTENHLDQKSIKITETTTQSENSNKGFTLIASGGVKVENLSKKDLMNIIKELKKDKAS